MHVDGLNCYEQFFLLELLNWVLTAKTSIDSSSLKQIGIYLSYVFSTHQ